MILKFNRLFSAAAATLSFAPQVPLRRIIMAPSNRGPSVRPTPSGSALVTFRTLPGSSIA